MHKTHKDRIGKGEVGSSNLLVSTSKTYTDQFHNIP